MGKITYCLRNRNVILVLALLLGLFFPQGVNLMQYLTLPALGIVMVLSTMGVSGSVFRSPRSLMAPAFLGILMNYVVLTGFILGMSALLIHDEELWRGFIIVALVPPAVAVIAFTESLKGNSTYSLIGTMGAYMGALIIMPPLALKLLGSNLLDPNRISLIAVVLIIVPLVLSRILLRKGIGRRVEPIKGTITNWCFFAVFYTIVGLNQHIFVEEPFRLVPIVGIAVASMFFLGFIIERIGRFLGVDPEITTSLVLLGTIKNYGLAAGISLALFGNQTALPATVSTIFMFVYIIWLPITLRRPIAS
ncbi:MAG: hypothetical protein V1930_04870 [Pseudomonadota bacterium]